MRSQRSHLLSVVILLLLVPIAGNAAGLSPEAQAMSYLQEVWRTGTGPPSSLALGRTAATVQLASR
jgi:hypothetical protein